MIITRRKALAAGAAVPIAALPLAAVQAADPGVAAVEQIKHLLYVMDFDSDATDEEREDAWELKDKIERQLLKTRSVSIEGIAAKLRLCVIEDTGCVFKGDPTLLERDLDSLALNDAVVVSAIHDFDLLLGRATS